MTMMNNVLQSVQESINVWILVKTCSRTVGTGMPVELAPLVVVGLGKVVVSILSFSSFTS